MRTSYTSINGVCFLTLGKNQDVQDQQEKLTEIKDVNCSNGLTHIIS